MIPSSHGHTRKRKASLAFADVRTGLHEGDMTRPSAKHMFESPPSHASTHPSHTTKPQSSRAAAAACVNTSCTSTETRTEDFSHASSSSSAIDATDPSTINVAPSLPDIPTWIDPRVQVWSLLASSCDSHTSLEQWQRMFVSEEKTIPCVFYADQQPFFDSFLRANTIRRMLDLAVRFPRSVSDEQERVTSRNTFHRAVQLLDRFVGLTHGLKNPRLAKLGFHEVNPGNAQAYGIAALLAADKWEHSVSARTSDLSNQMTNILFSTPSSDDMSEPLSIFIPESEIKSSELKILEVIGFNVCGTTIPEWIHAYLFQIVRLALHGSSDLTSPFNESKVMETPIPAVQKLLCLTHYRRVMQLADFALLHSRIWLYYPSTFAAALLWFVYDGDADLSPLLTQCTKYTADDLSAPISYIKQVAQVVHGCTDVHPNYFRPIINNIPGGSTDGDIGDARRMIRMSSDVVTLDCINVCAYTHYEDAARHLLNLNQTLTSKSHTALPKVLPPFHTQRINDLLSIDYQAFHRRLPLLESSETSDNNSAYSRSLDFLKNVVSQCLALLLRQPRKEEETEMTMLPDAPIYRSTISAPAAFLSQNSEEDAESESVPVSMRSSCPLIHRSVSVMPSSYSPNPIHGQARQTRRNK